MTAESKRKIPFSPPDITDAEINEVVEALRSGWITTGPKTKKLEKLIAEYVGGYHLCIHLHSYCFCCRPRRCKACAG